MYELELAKEEIKLFKTVILKNNLLVDYKKFFLIQLAGYFFLFKAFEYRSYLERVEHYKNKILMFNNLNIRHTNNIFKQ